MKWWLFTIGICQVVLRVSTCPSKSGIPPDEQWVNSLTKKLNFECPSGHSISRIESAFDGRDFDDRVWRMTCRFAEDKIINKDCFWTPWLNEYDRPLTYQCPYGRGTMYALAGMVSQHSSKTHDRIWKFRCCGLQGCKATKCVTSNFANEVEGAIDFKIPKGSYLTGGKSYHDNYYEDRKWRFTTCQCQRKH